MNLRGFIVRTRLMSEAIAASATQAIPAESLYLANLCFCKWSGETTHGILGYGDARYAWGCRRYFR